jgi:hypothetical protein
MASFFLLPVSADPSSIYFNLQSCIICSQNNNLISDDFSFSLTPNHIPFV